MAATEPRFQQLTVARPFEVRRSELTCPGHSARMMQKAAASGADEVIFDLEDAVAVSMKAAARASVIEALNTLSFGSTVRAYRVNGVRTAWCYRDVVDVLEAAGQNVDVLVVPKVEAPDEVQFIDHLLSGIEQAKGFAPGRIKLEALIESARGLLAAREIAAASPRMASLIFGIADYAGDVGAKGFAEQPYAAFHYPRAHVVAAARAAGIAAIDAVTVQFKDLARVAQDAADGAQLGFDGKWAIHPSHLAPIHAAYTPTRAEIDRARQVMEAYAKADVQHGLGAIVLGDEMVDAASLRVEWKKLAVARKAGLVDEHFAWIGG
ncbi:MAG: CoA ester lyase [Deltaproteobacteria bacterium]|nr:CoA ester lyase [Deltaproteobacteria bacterium]